MLKGNALKSWFRGGGLSRRTRSLSSSLPRRQRPDEKDETGSSQEFRAAGAQLSRMTDLGSRRIFNSDQDMFRQAVRKFMIDEMVPHMDEFEEAGQPSREIWEAMGTQGLIGVNIPEEIGGIGGSFIDEMIVNEELAYNFITYLDLGIHSTIVMPYIHHYGTKQQQDRYIPEMTAGRLLGSLGMTEPDAGSDLQGIRTHAKRDGSDWIINGSKIYITGGWLCDVCIVVAKTNPDAKKAAHGLSLFLVDADTPGFHKGSKLKKLGLKSQDTAELFFEDVRVPGSALLGNLNEGFYMLMDQLPQERLSLAVHSSAIAEAIFEETRDWVKERKAFGRRVADLQTVQHKLAELKTSIAVNRAFTDECIELHSQLNLSGEMASMAKYWATDLENKVAGECLQLHGGWGFMWETKVAKTYANARVKTIYGGTNEIMKELIARNITKQ